MIIDAVVPAYNEQATVAQVVRTLVQSRCFRKVTVVDDGSSDRTSAEASSAGAVVIRLSPNQGKGGAMLAGVRASDAPFIAFFDADLVELSLGHPAMLVAPILAGQALMSCGLRDYGGVYNRLQSTLPPITGERVVSRRILERIPAEFWNGWRIEAAINETARQMNAPVTRLILPGLRMRPKWVKVGLKRGIEDGVKMMVQVLCAMRDAQESLRSSGPLR